MATDEERAQMTGDGKAFGMGFTDEQWAQLTDLLQRQYVVHGLPHVVKYPRVHEFCRKAVLEAIGNLEDDVRRREMQAVRAVGAAGDAGGG